MSPEQLAVIDAYAPRFREATAGMPYIRRGVFWSELLAFAALADAAGTRYIVESGTGLGFSARVLARLFPHVVTIGLEERPSGLPDNVEFVQGNILQHMSSLDVSERTAFLIDGPKNQMAVALAAKAIKSYVGLQMLAIHDLHHDSVGRELAAMMFPNMTFTDNAAYVAKYGHMDAECLAMAAKRGKRFPAHGPTMGIVVL